MEDNIDEDAALRKEMRRGELGSMENVPFGGEIYEYSRYILDDELLSTIEKDKGLPEGLKVLARAFLNKEFALTSLPKDTDIAILMNDFDDATVAYLMSIPAYRHTFEHEELLATMRAKFYAKLKRSQGPDRERKMQATQIRQMIYSEDEGRPKTGFLGRFFGGGK